MVNKPLIRPALSDKSASGGGIGWPDFLAKEPYLKATSVSKPAECDAVDDSMMIPIPIRQQFVHLRQWKGYVCEELMQPRDAFVKSNILSSIWKSVESYESSRETNT